MDESAFRRARAAIAQRPCVFEMAILARCCACSLAERQNIAEREALACSAPAAREQCALLRALLRQKSAFALKLTHVDTPLPHAQEMKVECGGLHGLQQAAAPASAGALAAAAQELPLVADVRSLVQAGIEKFGALENLPYSAIVQSVVAHRIRRRRPEQ